MSSFNLAWMVPRAMTPYIDGENLFMLLFAIGVLVIIFGFAFYISSDDWSE